MSDKIKASFRVNINKGDYPVKDKINCIDMTEFHVDYVLAVHCGRTFETISYHYDINEQTLSVASSKDDLIITYTSSVQFRDIRLDKILNDDDNKR